MHSRATGTTSTDISSSNARTWSSPFLFVSKRLRSPPHACLSRPGKWQTLQQTIFTFFYPSKKDSPENRRDAGELQTPVGGQKRQRRAASSLRWGCFCYGCNNLEDTLCFCSSCVNGRARCLDDLFRYHLRYHRLPLTALTKESPYNPPLRIRAKLKIRWAGGWASDQREW